VADDITMAALSGTASRYDIAHWHDCDCRCRCAGSILGRTSPLAVGHPTGALAFAARLGVWFVGGAGLAIGMALTAMALARFQPAHWSACWLGGIAFICIELLVHLVLQLRGRSSFYSGRG
jgi:hypothetical protein